LDKKQIIPARNPKSCGGNKKILYDVNDDVKSDDDVNSNNDGNGDNDDDDVMMILGNCWG
jgi:hypothetical protein